MSIETTHKRELTMYRPIRTDDRYTINLEYCGYDTPRHVLRFCGEFIASSISKSSMVVRAVGHKAERDGALVVQHKD